MTDLYHTIRNKSEGLYKEKGSRFISFAFPVTSAEEVKNIIQSMRKEYHDARHVCYAYILGYNAKDTRANDDGEPSGTAGRPILGQINSRGLTNVLVVVVRYFGGVLLGTGGLVVAYKEATIDALDHAEIIERTEDVEFSVTFEYPLLNEVMRIVKEEGITLVEQRFEMTCFIQMRIRKANADKVKARLQKINGLILT